MVEKGGGKTVEGVAVENPLSRGGHTQVAAFGAFSKTGGPCLVEKVGGETVG